MSGEKGAYFTKVGMLSNEGRTVDLQKHHLITIREQLIQTEIVSG